MPGRRESQAFFVSSPKEFPMKTQSKALTTGKSPDDASRSSGSRGAARTGTKKASNAHAAQRQGEKASANKASSSKRSAAGEKKSTPSTR
jgi:hypothetical protein